MQAIPRGAIPIGSAQTGKDHPCKFSRAGRCGRNVQCVMPLFRFNILQPDPTSGAQAVPRLFDTTQEARVTFETVLKPVFF